MSRKKIEPRTNPSKRNWETPLLSQRLAWLRIILNDPVWSPYKPFTVRNIHYQFIQRGFMSKGVPTYNAVKSLCTDAREDGLVDCADFEDQTRIFQEAEVWEDKQEFFEEQILLFLNGYKRDCMQTQPYYLEVWIEKVGLRQFFTPVTDAYGIPLVCAAGNASVTFKSEYVTRLKKQNKPGVILFFADFDPSGVKMDPELDKKIRIMGGTNFVVKRVALLQADLARYGLSLDEIGEKDKKAPAFRAKYGDEAAELDGLEPDELQGRLQEAISWYLDADKFNEEVEKQKKELIRLEQLKQWALDLMIQNPMPEEEEEKDN